MCDTHSLPGAPCTPHSSSHAASYLQYDLAAKLSADAAALSLRSPDAQSGPQPPRDREM